jgi:hypothetical protein
MIGVLFSLALAAATPEAPKAPATGPAAATATSKAEAPPKPAAAAAPPPAPITPEAGEVAARAAMELPERYRMVLGAEVGRFNDWEKYDLKRFAGFQAVIGAGNIRGKPKDTWASVARVNLIGAGEGKSRPVAAFVLKFDRKTHAPLAYLNRSGSDKAEAFQITLPADKPIRVSVVVNRPGKMLVRIEGAPFEVNLPFEVTGISVVASGLDAVFEPFEILRRAP